MNGELLFGTLADVPLREAWAHEAHRFTPWLAGNLDRLSQAIGIPLELTGTEMRVGTFSADILARNPADDSVVLIENQLEASDHTHLGQIMTYLAGLETHTMVWVAPNFREEHLSAIRWLNEHTVDPFAFFAVRLRVVRIADSLLAPLFEVIERPNNWDRQIAQHKRAAEGDLTELGQHRLAFWTHLCGRHPWFGKPDAASSHWVELPGTEAVAVQYISKDGVGIFIRPRRGRSMEELGRELEPYLERLSMELDAPPGGVTSFLSQSLRGDARDQQNWDRMAELAGRANTSISGRLRARDGGADLKNGKIRGQSFVNEQRICQGRWLTDHLSDNSGYRGASYRLAPGDRRHNLAPELQDTAERLFSAEPVIQWHQHASHALSSQVCCINFLLPFAQQPELLARWIEHVTGDKVSEMLPVERGRAGEDWFVTFEWIGDIDHLNEAKPGTVRKRGANATAADAAVLYRDREGRTQLLLIEWKYTERYGAPLDPKGNETRRSRYRDIFRRPTGPIRADADVTLDDFFYEPFYQLLRQQMLAWHTERADPLIDRARVLHLSPSGNRALHDVTSPNLRRFGDDAFEVFSGRLADPTSFIGMTIEAAFAPLAGWPEADWYPWLCERYAFLTAASGEPA